MLRKELTAKQIKFCENIALKGMSQAEAYKDAYNCKKMKDKTIRNNAYQLTQNSDIARVIKERREKTAEKTVEKFSKSKVQILKEFEELIKKAKTEGGKIEIDEDGKPRLVGMEVKDASREMRECLKEQAKLLGYYEEKQHITVNVGVALKSLTEIKIK